MDIGEDLPEEVRPPKIHKCVLDVIEFFGKISSQWRTSFNGATGLDYVAVDKVAEIFGFELTPYNMNLIQEIEQYNLRKDSDNGNEQSNS